MKTKLFYLLLLLTIVLPSCAQKWEHLADTPQMGWSTWNKFQGNINEDIIMGIADVMVSSGLKDAGYTYINIDDCWHGKRDANGFIQVDSAKFPHGMKYLADYVHSKGLKLGIYSDAGTETCGGMPGSLGHEYQDALQYARWGIDYLKYDWCNTTNIDPRGAYQLMSDALRAAGRPILLSMCEWGSSRPWKWAREVGHSWRTTPDIWCDFDSLRVFPTYTQFGVMQCVNYNDTLRAYAGKGHWNDPDMLEVGNGMTVNEDRAHFTMWCMMASPLIIGNDIRHMSADTKAILENKELIAIDQDSLCVQGYHFKDEQGVAFWLKPLANGDWAFTLLNVSKRATKVQLNWCRLSGVKDDVSGRTTDFADNIYKVRDLWKHKIVGKTSKKDQVSMVVDVPARDVIAFRLMK